MTPSIKAFFETPSINDTQRINIEYHYAECRNTECSYAESNYAESYYAECCYADCHGASCNVL